MGGVPPFSAKSAEKDGATAELGDRCMAHRHCAFPGPNIGTPGHPGAVQNRTSRVLIPVFAVTAAACRGLGCTPVSEHEARAAPRGH